MDFGQVGTDRLMGQGQDNSGVSGPGEEPKTKSNGSGMLKQEGSVVSVGPPVEKLDCTTSKVSRGPDDLGLSKTMLGHQQGNHGLRSDGSDARMLGFSSPNQEVSFLSKESDSAGAVGAAGGVRDKSSQDMPLFCQQYAASYAYTRNPGFGCGSMNESFSGIKGPFTPAQWIELEHQALIYKYLDANVPVPANLIIPVRKSLASSGFPGLSAASFPSHPYGWGPFHLGYSGSTDSEPGRCRRTDGKKWRCSREAIPDQKYCERHMNRSRHRSRKPVEGQKGQAASASTNKKMVLMPPLLSSSVTASGSSTSNCLGNAPHHVKGLQPGTFNSSYSTVKRFEDCQGPSALPPTISLKSKESPFSIPRQGIPFKESCQPEFGVSSPGSLLNHSVKISYLNSRTKNSTLLTEFNGQQTQNDHPLRHFIEDWPRIPCDNSSSDWTQLSISIPMSVDLTSSSSFPDGHRASLSSLRFSRDLQPTLPSSGAGVGSNEPNARESSWVPISWGNTMGGPLAEVLNNAGSSGKAYKCTSALNFVSEAWDGSSLTGSSPTDVLQMVGFTSSSNSSSVTSPVAEYKKTQESTGLCNDLLGLTHGGGSLSTATW